MRKEEEGDLTLFYYLVLGRWWLILATEVPFPGPTGLSILQELLSIVGDSTLNERGIFRLVLRPGTADAYVFFGYCGNTLICFNVESIFKDNQLLSKAYRVGCVVDIGEHADILQRIKEISLCHCMMHSPLLLLRL